MSFQFEQALRRKCEQDTDLSLLLSQWEYDRRLVADALQTVGRVFPHYSRHDASHSNSILVQLARILGPARIEALSATDLWLLLEAAYQHDIGMVVTDAQVRAWWGSAEFKDFLAQLRHGGDDDLKRAAEALGARAGSADRPEAWPIEVSRDLTLVVAEYARRQHARNAERIVRDPARTIGLLSPRTPLIPARLFNLLGSICAHHGRSLDDTLRLPLRESGIGTDHAHPRFVACMLRLGDLLDLDNGRFCPVMLRSFGALPLSSQAHVDKHASITHLEVGPARIEVEAACETYESYEATDQWLTWLREELKEQMARWSDVAPLPDFAGFGALPSLGPISAHMKGHIALEPGRRPRFEVDRESILTLVKGANIYEEPVSCIRELLQNAVDATLLRLWRERLANRPAEEIARMTPADLREELKSYVIRVRFTRLEEGPAGSAEMARWRVTVEDQGTGISLEDLRHIQRIGASSKNPDRRRTIEAMPEWMRPSGIFGIGLQSAFLFTDEVRMSTRHHENREVLGIVLRNGTSTSMDGLSIRRLEGEDAAGVSIGTKIEFDIEVKRIPERFYLSGEGAEAERTWKNFDPIVATKLPYAVASARDVVRSFSEACACIIELDGNPINVDVEQLGHRKLDFDAQSNLDPAFEAVAGNRNAIIYYRGAPVQESTLTYRMLQVWCNACFDRADRMLQISREDLTRAGEELLRRRIQEAVERKFPAYIESLRKNGGDPRELALASLRSLLYMPSSSVSGDEWRSLPLDLRSGEVTLGQITSCDRVTLRRWAGRRLARHLSIDGETWHELEFHRGYNRSLMSDLLSKLFSCKTLDATFDEDGLAQYWVFTTQPVDEIVTPEGLRSMLVESVFDWNGRGTLPCSRRHAMLQYDRGANLPLAEHHIDWFWPRMVCPFMFRDEKVVIPAVKELVLWTAKNAEGGPKPERDVASALLDFIREADELMAMYWKERKGYDLQRVEYELGAWLR